MSMDRSRKDSSREETVSHVRHRVSLVRVPSKSLCTRVDFINSAEELVCGPVAVVATDKEPIEADTVGCTEY